MEPNQDYSFDCNKYIDSHCHLQDYSSVELEQVLSNCISKGLQLIYTNATNKDDFDSTLDISKDKSSGKIKIFPGIGYHPWSLEYPINNKDTWFEEYKDYINKNLIQKKIPFFIGEIGIDGGKIKKTYPLPEQIEIFKLQLQYANDNNLLVHIHCVYEWDKLYKIMSTMKLETLKKKKKIILHSFQGKVKHIEKFNKMNAYYSISSGCFSKSNYPMLEALPNNQILLESDAPSMFNKDIYDNEECYKNFPKGEKIKNHPESIIFLCDKFAELKQLSSEEFRKIILNNCYEIFKSITEK